MQLARERGCPWDEETCCGPLLEGALKCCGGRKSTAVRGTGRRVARAVSNGLLEMLQWARERDTDADLADSDHSD